MAQSLRKRFAGREQKILDYTGKEGQLRAMRELGENGHPIDGIAFRKWLARKEVANDENFGLCPKAKSDLSKEEKLVKSLLYKVANLEAEKAQLNAKAEFLQWQLARRNGGDVLSINGILDPLLV